WPHTSPRYTVVVDIRYVGCRPEKYARVLRLPPDMRVIGAAIWPGRRSVVCTLPDGRLRCQSESRGVGMARTATAAEQAGSEDWAGPAGLTTATIEPPAWRGRYAGPFAIIGLATIGLRRAWALLGVLSLGMVVAVTLICTVPLYSNLVSTVQVQHTLA